MRDTIRMLSSVLQAAACVLAFVTPATAQSRNKPAPVNVHNFVRAETDLYFSRLAAAGFGKFSHRRKPASIDDQTVVRMNRDTLYSSAVFDLDAAPVTVTLPDAGGRFMSMQAISQDHYSPDVVYGPGRFTFDRATIGTRYMALIIRTLANAEDAKDVAAANKLQDAVTVTQAKQRRVRDSTVGCRLAGQSARCAVCTRRARQCGEPVRQKGRSGSARSSDRHRDRVGRQSACRRRISKRLSVPERWRDCVSPDAEGCAGGRLLVRQRLQFRRLLREERSQRLFAQQPHSEDEQRRRGDGSVRQLREGHPELLADHVGMEFHHALLSSAQRDPRRQLEGASAAAGGVKSFRGRGQHQARAQTALTARGSLC